MDFGGVLTFMDRVWSWTGMSWEGREEGKG